MDATPGHIAEVLFIYPGGYAYIAAVEINRERMFAEVLSAGLKIIMHLAQDM